MRVDLVEILRCPETGARLEIAHIARFFELAGNLHVVEGLLVAEGDRNRRFPILDEIPRLLPSDQLLPEERAFLDHLPAKLEPTCAAAIRVDMEVVDQAAIAAEIRSRMERLYRLDQVEEPEARRRAEGEIRYMNAEAAGNNKRKYLPLVLSQVEGIESLLEAGGNFPGLSQCLAEKLKPRRIVVANLAILFPRAFKTADRRFQAVRADVRALPFAVGSFDLIVTAFMLEHVPNWRRALASMAAVGRELFVAFGPNKYFPFEVGHINAPLAGTLPKSLATPLAWLWLAILGRRRPLKRIRAILDEVYHVASPTFAREARRHGFEARNLFPDLVESILQDQNAPPTAARRLLKRWPKLARASARVLTRLGMEPQMYYFLARPRRDLVDC